MDEWGIAGFDLFETGEMIENTIIHKRRPKRANFNALNGERLSEIVTALPKDGETFHIVSNGKYDFWSFVPVCLTLMGNAAEFYGSTWTMNRANVLEMLDLYDTKRIGALNILTGTYFKARESAVCNTLIEGCQQRGQRFLAFQNHAKIVLLRNAGMNLVIEGSANFTANPRLEQYTMSNDAGLYEFHRGWMEEMFSHAKQGD